MLGRYKFILYWSVSNKCAHIRTGSYLIILIQTYIKIFTKGGNVGNETFNLAIDTERNILGQAVMDMLEEGLYITANCLAEYLTAMYDESDQSYA